MTVDLARLAVAVDSREARQATTDLAALARQGGRTERATENMARSADNLSTRFGGLRGIAARLAGVLGGLGIGVSFAAAVRTTMTFSSAISDLSALTGATGRDLEYLSNAARQMGATTSLSASQAATAMKLIASAKPELLESGEALAAVTRQAALLSEASGLDLPAAATALSSALNQFRMPAEEAARVVNVLAAGAKLGAAEIPAVTEALSKAGTVASTAGVSFEQFVATIQRLAAFGQPMERVATSVRNILLRLQAGAAETNPAIVGLETALRNLAAQQMSVAEMTKLFGVENVVVAQQMMETATSADALSRAITGTNTATEQAEARLDNLSGDFLRLSSVVQEALLQVGERGLVGAMRSLAQTTTGVLQVLTGMTESLGENERLYRALALAVQLAVSAFAAMAAASIARMIAGIAVATWEAVKAMLALNVAFRASPIGVIATVVGALASAFMFLALQTGEANAATRTYETSLRDLQGVNQTAADQAEAMGRQRRQEIIQRAESALAIEHERLAILNLVEARRQDMLQGMRTQQAFRRSVGAPEAGEGVTPQILQDIQAAQARIGQLGAALAHARGGGDSGELILSPMPTRTGGGGTEAQPSATTPGDSSKVIDELTGAYERLRGQLDPIGEATRSYLADMKTLDAALRTGLIPTEGEHADMVRRLGMAYDELRFPEQEVAAHNRQLEQLLSRYAEGPAAVEALRRQFEHENEARRIGLDLFSEQGLAWIEAMRRQEELTAAQVLLDEIMAGSRDVLIQYNEQLERLNALRMEGIISAETFAQGEARITQAIEAETGKRSDIEKTHWQQVTNMQTQAANNIIGMMQSITGQSKAAALAALVIQKGLAIAQTIASTHAAAMRAMAELGPIAGPPVAAAIHAAGKLSVATIAALGLAQAASIGRSGGSGRGGVAGVGQAPGFQAETLERERPRELRVTIEGEGMMSPSQVRDLIEVIGEQMGNGARLVVAR